MSEYSRIVDGKKGRRIGDSYYICFSVETVGGLERSPPKIGVIVL